MIVRWLKKTGEAVREGEPLVEVETDKAAVEVESPAAGTLLEILVREGAEVAVMTPIAMVAAQGEDSNPVPPRSLSPALHGEPTAQLPAVQPVAAPQPVAAIPGASPRAARLACSIGMDLAGVVGTGPAGRIIERDVRGALARQNRKETEQPVDSAISSDAASAPEARACTPLESSSRTVPPAFPGPSREVPFSGIRAAIAERMLRSLSHAAQLTLHAAADVRMLLGLRDQLNAQRETLGQERLTLNDLVLLAVSRVLLEFRGLNAHCLADRVVEYEHVHLGMAVETPRGLMAPVIRFAERKDLHALVTEARRLTKMCREGTVRPEDLQGGTFTVTNLGALGVETFTPILNPPEVAILGVGAIQQRPCPGDVVGSNPHLLLSLTFDHRALDGAPAARFLKRLAEAVTGIDCVVAGSVSPEQPPGQDFNGSSPCPSR